MNDVTGKVAIVPVGASDIGRTSSILLATSKPSVVVTDIDENAAAETAEKIKRNSDQAVSIHQDVVDESRWQEVIDTANSAFGALNILVNNAGLSGAEIDSHAAGDLASWRRVMEVNLDAVYLGCCAAVAAMRKDGGSIVNISSIYGIVGGAGPAYNASKGTCAVTDQVCRLALWR
tara:strand:+ start:46 stop:573 length:528 start_codon:yes stop_codon:yes gene_type:complete